MNLWLAIDAQIRAALDRVVPFRAIAKAEASGLVTIRREDAAADDLEAYARVDGIEFTADDEIAVVRMGGRPLILGRIRRSVRTAPSIAAGAGAGTGGSLSVTLSASSSDRVGRIVIVTGNSPAAGILATVTLGTSRPNTDYAVVLSPADSDAEAVVGYMDFNSRTANTWQLRTGHTPAANTSHHWYFMVRGFRE